MTYDSRPETWKHILQVRRLLNQAAFDLLDRAGKHDASKLVEPELSMFNEFRPKLDAAEHDSPEYNEHLRQMGEALQHHYRENRHHPEHFAEGVHGMNLLDLLEMLCDWMAAAGRTGGDVHESIQVWGRNRFGYGDEIEGLLHRTLDYMEAQ